MLQVRMGYPIMDPSLRQVIAHYVSPYLCISGSYVHNQLTHLQKYKPIVITCSKENLDIFPFDSVYAYSDLRRMQRLLLRLWKNGLRNGVQKFSCRVMVKSKAVLLHSHFGPGGVECLELKR